jgi:putative heme iron utilization protein
MAEHLPRLARELRTLIDARRVGALGTLADDGAPFVSMVPFARAGSTDGACLVIHVSGLAAHTRHLRRDARASLLLMQAEDGADDPLALARVTIELQAQEAARGTDLHQACRSSYLARFAQAQMISELPDFAFFALWPRGARHVAGFGAARAVEPDELQHALAPDRTAP